MSSDLAKKLRLGLGELATIREQMAPILDLPPDGTVGVIERAAACAMLHSFYTEIEKILKLVARELGRTTAFIGFLAQGVAKPNGRLHRHAASHTFVFSGRSPERVSGFQASLSWSVDCADAMGKARTAGCKSGFDV